MTESGSSRQTPGALPTVEQIFKGHAAYVAHTLRRLGVHSSDLEDLTHDVFLVVHRKLAEFDPARPLKPWLFGIALRVAQSNRRRAGKREVPSDVEDAEDAGAGEGVLEERRRRRLVHRALAAVDDSRVAVFVLHDLDGVAMPEIAASLGIPLNTGYSRLRLAREEFRRAARELLGEGGAP